MLVGLLLLSAAPALADEGDAKGRNDDSGRGQPGRIALGAFAIDTGTHSVKGEFMSFAYDRSGIQSFTVHGVGIFNATVQPSTSGAQRDPPPVARGAEIRVFGPGYAFIAHDNPVAVARLTTDGPAALTFAPGVALTRQGEGRLAFTLGNLTGALRAERMSVSGQTVRTQGEVLFLLDESGGSYDAHRSDITEAIAARHVGAEASFNRNGEDLKEDVVSYGNVTMTTLRAEQGNLTMLIEGHGTEGRVLVLNVDNHVMGAQRKEELRVQLDNQTVTAASSLEDILDPDNDGFVPEYYVVFDPATDAFQLLVSVPHYSVHTLSLTTAIILPPPSVLVGIGLGVLLLVPTAFVLFRRPK
jgi:hypothetical protein